VAAERAETILLVEDDENDVLLVQRAFRKAGVANPLRVLGDGDAAVAYLSGEGVYADRRVHPLPGLLLLDLKLPRRSGLEVLGWLRQQRGLGRLITVVLTSSRESSDVNRAYELGANSYLVKPVLLGDLVEMVKRLDLYWLLTNEKPDLRNA
jgi:CheY-like chemotaxis protein